MIGLIKNLLMKIKKEEPKRAKVVKKKLEEKIRSNLAKENFDKSRLEQELIFYLEKLDITEEMVRLDNHSDYFLKTMKEKVGSKGKKLGFISQEIGREINTIGSKANSLPIQKLVVQMKDELEKIKEQLANIL